MQALGHVWGNFDPVNADIEEVRTPIATPTQYGARLLLDHWQACKAGPGFVVGRDVPSRALAGVLRNLALYEPLKDKSDFRMRLAGTAYTRRFGRDVTGLKLSEMYGESHFGTRRANLVAVIETNAPEIAEVKIERNGRVFLRYEALKLPVLSPDRKDVWIMGAFFYFDWA